MSASLTLYLVRHAESQNNALPEHQRVSDPPLTDLGLQQAEKLGARLHRESQNGSTPEVILTSPFLRTMKTIHPASTRLSQSPVIWSNLYEAGGCYEGHIPGQTSGKPGMTRSDISEQFPGYVIPDDIDENGWYRHDDFEPWQAASKRAKDLSIQLLDTFAGKSNPVLCMIHGDLIRLLLSHFCPADSMLSNTDVANTSVTCLQFNADAPSAPDVLMHNNTDHLKPQEISF